MKYLLTLLISFTVLSCGSDDETMSNSFDVTIGYTTNYGAGINWTTPTQSVEGTVSYRVVLEGEVLAENYTGNSWDFENLFSDYEYSGSIFAVDTAGNSTVSNFSFSTEITPFNPNCGGCFITLRTQTEVDNLPPYTYISELTISATGSNDHITNLNALSNLQRINRFNIWDATITNLDGLENLSEVGIFWVLRNSNLNDMNALENLFSQDSMWFLLKDNPNLTDISSLTIRGDRFELEDSPDMALPAIASNCSNCRISFENVNITNLDGFNSSQIMGQLTIKNAPLLNDISGLNNIISYSNLQLENIPELNDLSALSNAITFGTLQLENIPQLNNFNALSNATTFGTLQLKNLSQLNNLNGLNNINSIENIYLYNLSQLNSLSFLSGVTSLQKVIFNNLPQLNSLPSLPNITSLHSLGLYYLPSISAISGLENLTAIEKISIYELDGITSLEGLNNLTSSSGNSDRAKIFIYRNNQLTDFCALTTYAINTTSGGFEYIDGHIYPDFDIDLNAFNPTEAQIESTTECSI